MTQGCGLFFTKPFCSRIASEVKVRKAWLGVFFHKLCTMWRNNCLMCCRKETRWKLSGRRRAALARSASLSTTRSLRHFFFNRTEHQQIDAIIQSVCLILQRHPVVCKTNGYLLLFADEGAGLDGLALIEALWRRFRFPLVDVLGVATETTLCQMIDSLPAKMVLHNAIGKRTHQGWGVGGKMSDSNSDLPEISDFLNTHTTWMKFGCQQWPRRELNLFYKYAFCYCR